LAAVQAAVFCLLSQDESKCLASVVLTVKLRHGGIGVGFVVPELLFRFALTIAGGDKIVPIVQFLHRCVPGRLFHNETFIINLGGRADNRHFSFSIRLGPALAMPLEAHARSCLKTRRRKTKGSEDRPPRGPDSGLSNALRQQGTSKHWPI